MAYTMVDVEVGLEDFSDDELLRELVNRGLGADTLKGVLDDMPVGLRDTVLGYLRAHAKVKPCRWASCL